MKVTFKNMLQGYVGKADGMIYYLNKRTGKVYARRQFKFEKHSGHTPFRQAQKQIYLIKPAAEYKYNLYDYCLSYNELPQNQEQQVFSWCHIYNKLMWAMQKAMPAQVDLKTITREQIYEQNLPCKTLKAAIEVGLLPMVDGYQRWDKEI
ncbi:MAG: hypothetical protein FJ041_01565 [Candidatus Cloacimonetes bacterium]|nr:hypothetical protein [Candidatus Cloacimonadota bacterium]